MDQETQKTDHDNLVTIIEQVKNLAQSQTSFHEEMRRSFDDLKNNYTGRLNNLDMRVAKLETSKVKQNVTMSIGIGLLTLLTSVIIYHVMGK